MVRASDASPSEVRRVNQQLEERHYEFRSNCNDGDGDASACHSWGEWLAVVDKNYADAGAWHSTRTHLAGWVDYTLTPAMVASAQPPCSSSTAPRTTTRRPASTSVGSSVRLVWS
jgi:hypothetical protein